MTETLPPSPTDLPADIRRGIERDARMIRIGNSGFFGLRAAERGLQRAGLTPEQYAAACKLLAELAKL